MLMQWFVLKLGKLKLLVTAENSADARSKAAKAIGGRTNAAHCLSVRVSATNFSHVNIDWHPELPYRGYEGWSHHRLRPAVWRIR